MENGALGLAETTAHPRLTHIAPRPMPCYASSNHHNSRNPNVTHEAFHIR